MTSKVPSKDYKENYAEIFGREPEDRLGRTSRKRLIWDRDFEMLRDANELAQARSNQFNELRSDLPCPMFIPDVQEHQNMVTGEIVTSRSRHREILRERGLVEVGNEDLEKHATKDDWIKDKQLEREICQTVKDSIEQLEAGTAQPVLPQGHPGAGTISIDTSVVSDSPTYVRTDI